MTKSAAIPHTFWCSTRWGDLDALGHVNNIKLIQYIQEAIFDLIREGEQDDVFPDGYMIARHEVDYRRQLHHRADQPLPLQIWVTAIGTNSYTVRTETRRAGETVFEARTVCVARDHRTGMSRPLTEAERAHLTRHRVVEPAPRTSLGTNADTNPGSNPGSNSGPDRQRQRTVSWPRREYLPTDITAAMTMMRRGWQLWKTVVASRSSA